MTRQEVQSQNVFPFEILGELRDEQVGISIPAKFSNWEARTPGLYIIQFRYKCLHLLFAQCAVKVLGVNSTIRRCARINHPVTRTKKLRMNSHRLPLGKGERKCLAKIIRPQAIRIKKSDFVRGKI